MTQFAGWTDPTKTSTKIVQASDAETLEKLVNAYIATLNGLTTVITAITLAGAGDGFTFVVLIETAPVGAGNSTSSLVVGADGGLVPSVSGLPVTQVRCYLAANAEALQKAKGFIVPFTLTVGQVSAPSVVVDQQVAGAAKGTRFMGMNVYTVAGLPLDVFEPDTLFPIAQETFAAPTPALPGGHLVTFTPPPIVGANWSLASPNEIQYDGAGSFLGKFDATITVSAQAGTAPVPFSAFFLENPVGAPIAFGSVDATIDVIPGSENVGLVSIRAVTRQTPGQKFGIGVFSSATATMGILGGFIRIMP